MPTLGGGGISKFLQNELLLKLETLQTFDQSDVYTKAQKEKRRRQKRCKCQMDKSTKTERQNTKPQKNKQKKV